MDETEVSTVQDPWKNLAKTAHKRVSTVTSWERRKTVITVCALRVKGIYGTSHVHNPRQGHFF